MAYPEDPNNFNFKEFDDDNPDGSEPSNTYNPCDFSVPTINLSSDDQDNGKTDYDTYMKPSYEEEKKRKKNERRRASQRKKRTIQRQKRVNQGTSKSEPTKKNSEAEKKQTW